MGATFHSVHPSMRPTATMEPYAPGDVDNSQQPWTPSSTHPQTQFQPARYPYHAPFFRQQLDPTASATFLNSTCDTINNTDQSIDVNATIPYRIETTYACLAPSCNKKYSRKPDLIRHYRGAHLHDQRHKCRVPGCERSTRGFPRRDKRDDHERKVQKRKT